MSSNPNPLAKRTVPQLALLHAAESVGVSAGTTIIAAIYQYWLTHGLNFQGLAQVAGLSFIGALGLVYKTIQGNPNVGPAVADTIAQFKAEVQLLLAAHFQGISQLIAQITGSAPLPQQSQPAAQVNPRATTSTVSPQVQQVPFPVNRNWTAMSQAVQPPQQPGQTQ